MASTLPNSVPWSCVSGWRLDARPHVGLDISGPGYFLRPNVAWDLTQYALRDAGAPDSSPQRSLPILDVDTGLQFERLAGSGGARTMTLEPRVMYVYIPYRDQNSLPIFDTSTPDLNSIELFRPNRYVGVDRIGDDAVGRPAPVLQPAGGHPAAAREEPGTDQAPGVVVVTLVPAVVGPLEARVGLDQREQHAPHLHRVVPDATDVQWIVHDDLPGAVAPVRCTTG